MQNGMRHPHRHPSSPQLNLVSIASESPFLPLPLWTLSEHGDQWQCQRHCSITVIKELTSDVHSFLLIQPMPILIDVV